MHTNRPKKRQMEKLIGKLKNRIPRDGWEYRKTPMKNNLTWNIG